MLRSIKKIYGDKLGASDGEIGHVKDFYFDDRNWAIRYVVADTGSWLPGRKVLISPYSLGRLDQAHKILCVNLTREQIEKGPPIEAHKPISRQYEEEYYQYFGWPYYWQGDGLWGESGFPMLQLPPLPLQPSVKKRSRRARPDPDDHLRSTRAMNGYRLRSGKKIAGHVCDFMVDPASWAIRQLVIRTGNPFFGKEDMWVDMQNVTRISYEYSTVFAGSNQRDKSGPAPYSVPEEQPVELAERIDHF